MNTQRAAARLSHRLLIQMPLLFSSRWLAVFRRRCHVSRSRFPAHLGEEVVAKLLQLSQPASKHHGRASVRSVSPSELAERGSAQVRLSSRAHRPRILVGTDRHTGRQAGRQPARPTDQPTDRPTDIWRWHVYMDMDSHLAVWSLLSARMRWEMIRPVP